MIKDNQKYFNRLHLLVDAGIVAISYLLAWYIKFGTVFADTEPGVGALDTRIYFSYLYFVVPEYIILYYFFNMYAPKRATRRKYELEGIIKANCVGIVLFIVFLYMIHQPHFSRFMMGAFFAVNIILTTICRTLIRNMLLYFRKKDTILSTSC